MEQIGETDRTGIVVCVVTLQRKVLSQKEKAK